MAVETLKKASAPRTLWIRPCTVGTAPGRSSWKNAARKRAAPQHSKQDEGRRWEKASVVTSGDDPHEEQAAEAEAQEPDSHQPAIRSVGIIAEFMRDRIKARGQQVKRDRRNQVDQDEDRGPRSQSV